ncbi:unnamed protein product [Mytilus coruscus]|uniref:Uncharacterized protein n=1 Tax=Mytilus coruscus TaxID=42192 RepID=A0A6J8B817_MYTCO|nr:unnamed protein product [Mytilus coruscus]
MQVHPLNDLSDITRELFPSCITTASTTCHNSSFPVMSTGYDHTAVDMLTVPSFCDFDITPSSMESSVDPITFLLDADSKDSTTFHSVQLIEFTTEAQLFESTTAAQLIDITTIVKLIEFTTSVKLIELTSTAQLIEFPTAAQMIEFITIVQLIELTTTVPLIEFNTTVQMLEFTTTVQLIEFTTTVQLIDLVLQ